MTDFPSPDFRWRYTPSLFTVFTALPLAPVRFLHVNVLLSFYPVAPWFVLCLAICGLCSVLPSGPRKVLVFSFRLPEFVARFRCFECFASQTPAVQWYSLGSHKVCCTLLLYFALFSNFCFGCFASQTWGRCELLWSTNYNEHEERYRLWINS